MQDTRHSLPAIFWDFLQFQQNSVEVAAKNNRRRYSPERTLQSFKFNYHPGNLVSYLCPSRVEVCDSEQALTRVNSEDLHNVLLRMLSMFDIVDTHGSDSSMHGSVVGFRLVVSVSWQCHLDIRTLDGSFSAAYRRRLILAIINCSFESAYRDLQNNSILQMSDMIFLSRSF